MILHNVIILDSDHIQKLLPAECRLRDIAEATCRGLVILSEKIWQIPGNLASRIAIRINGTRLREKGITATLLCLARLENKWIITASFVPKFTVDFELLVREHMPLIQFTIPRFR